MASQTKEVGRKRLPWWAWVLTGIALVIVVGGIVKVVNRPAYTWTADSFEGRNPSEVHTKGRGQTYWQSNATGQGFYVTDVGTSEGANKTYCVSGAVGSSQASFKLGDATFDAKNGFFTRCGLQELPENKQVTFTVTNGQLQVYSVTRKR